jgi:hypothetical protein
MFRTDLLSIIRSLITVFTAIGICHTSYVDCLLARSLADSQHNWYVRVELNIKIKLRNCGSCWLLLHEYITMHCHQNVEISLYSSIIVYVTQPRKERRLSRNEDFIWE